MCTLLGPLQLNLVFNPCLDTSTVMRLVNAVFLINRYRVTGMEPAIRLVRLRNDNAIGSPTCPINLSHSADDLEIARDQLTRILACGDSVDICKVPHEDLPQAVLDLRDQCIPLPPSVDGGRVCELSARLEFEWFGRSLSSPDWPVFEPEELNERAVYEQTSLDYQSTVAPWRPDLASRVLRLDTYYEDVPEQTQTRGRRRRERRQRWPHQEPNPEQLASTGFFYNGTADGATCFWYLLQRRK